MPPNLKHFGSSFLRALIDRWPAKLESVHSTHSLHHKMTNQTSILEYSLLSFKGYWREEIEQLQFEYAKHCC